MNFKIVFYAFIICLTFFADVPLSSALMSSTNYTIFADDFYSGITATSANYRLENTTGESPAGSTTGTTYTILGGYQAMDRSSLSLSISNSSLNLGDLNSNNVNSASTEISVGSDSDTGYTLAISSASWLDRTLANVSGDSVNAGSEEYGFSISGIDANSSLLNKDNIVQAVTLMTSSTVVSGSTTSTLTFKASVSSQSSAGSRSQTIVLSLSRNL